MKNTIVTVILVCGLAAALSIPVRDIKRGRVRDAQPERQHPAPGYCIVQDTTGDYWLGSSEAKGLVYNHSGKFSTFILAVRKTWEYHDFRTNHTPVALPSPVGAQIEVDCTVN